MQVFFSLKNSRSPDLSGQSTTLSHLLSISTHVPSRQLNSEMLQALKLNSRRKTLESKLLFLLLLIGGGCSLQMPKNSYGILEFFYKSVCCAAINFARPFFRQKQTVSPSQIIAEKSCSLTCHLPFFLLRSRRRCAPPTSSSRTGSHRSR